LELGDARAACARLRIAAQLAPDDPSVVQQLRAAVRAERL
jgi:hypothetical protein